MKQLAAIVILLLLLLVRYQTTRPIYRTGDKVRISTKVTTEPIKYSYSQYLKLKGLKVYVPLFPEIGYGDRVVVEGVVGDDELKSARLIEVIEAEGALYKFRRKIIASYQKVLTEPHSSLIAGVTLGSKASIPKDFWESLKISGTAHVVVASGMNVTLVAGFLMNLLILFLPRGRAVIAALVGIWLYALMSGFDAPIVRAAIMGSIAFSAQAVGRINFAWRALFLSVLVMLLARPDWITDLGFILSFVATASLMLFGARVRKFLMWLPGFLREGLSTSLAAQVGVAPIIYASFGQFNIFSPVINAAVLWTIAPMTMIGMVGGLASLLSIQLGRLILLMSYPLTSWFVWVVEVFS